LASGGDPTSTTLAERYLRADGCRAVKSLLLPEFDATVRYFAIAGDGPVHVYLPSLLCPSTATLLQVATHPSLVGRAAILIDYLGCGASDWPASFPHTMPAHAATVAAVLDHEAVSGAVVVGHSMGGTVGLHLALDRPELVAQVVMAESNVYPGGGEGTSRIASFTEDDYVGRVAIDDVADLRERARAGDDLAGTLASIRAHGSDPRAVHTASVALVDLEPDLADRLFAAAFPAAFVYGSRTLSALDGRSTPDLPDRAVLEAHGIATFVVPGSGHFMYVENLDGYVDAIVAATADPRRR